MSELSPLGSIADIAAQNKKPRQMGSLGEASLDRCAAENGTGRTVPAIPKQ
jgi:hypothetical protein